MTVEAVWRPVGERTGSILDIAYFKPSAGSGGSRSERKGASGSPPEKRTA
jgi:hypothetical protein